MRSVWSGDQDVDHEEECEGGRDDEGEVGQEAGQQEEEDRDQEADVDHDDASDGRRGSRVHAKQLKQQSSHVEQ